MPEKKRSWVVRYHSWIGGTFVVLFLAFMGLVPFAFYHLQRYLLMQPDTILFENMVPSVMSFFPGIGAAGLLSLIVYSFAKQFIPDLDTASAYNSIITANRIYWDEYSKNVPWERAITKKDIEKVLKDEGQNSIKIIVGLFLFALPFFYLCFTTYRNVTSTTWTESFIGSKEVYELSNVEKVQATLELAEETDNGETELDGQMAMNVFFQGKTEPLSICNPECFYTQNEVKKLISIIDEESEATFEANELKRFERRFLQQNKPYLLELHREVEQR